MNNCVTREFAANKVKVINPAGVMKAISSFSCVSAVSRLQRPYR